MGDAIGPWAADGDGGIEMEDPVLQIPEIGHDHRPTVRVS